MELSSLKTEKYISYVTKTRYFGLILKTFQASLKMLTEEDLENYDLSQENADAVINVELSE